MRNLKKFLALVLAMLMVVSAAATVSAFEDVADDNSYAAAINDLVEKEITNGVGGDKFDPNGPVERYQMALYMARSLDPSNNDWQAGMAIFSDVTEWYGAIAYAYMNGIVTGIGNNKFDPHAGIQYQDALIMAVRALGYTVDVSGDPYWLAAYQQAEKLGLTANVGVNKGEQTLTRAQTAQVIYNMLYATPADGGATIAAKNFGEATPDNTTTFVVTATPKQAYADSYKAAEDGYVGVQILENGLPTGDVRYLPAEVFGIEKDEIENYFNYAFDFVNYNAKTGAFDRIIPVGEPTVVYTEDVTNSKDSVKLTIDGTVYYPVEQFTGAALKNEIVVLNGSEAASASKILLFDKDGNIVDYDGTIKATFAYETSNGDKYYADRASKKVITEAAALGLYGTPIEDGSYTQYSTLTASALYGLGNYQLTLFDDNRDGKYDRAVATPVYLSVFKAKGSDGKEDVEGAMYDETNVVYTEKLVKGDVFTYTYNKQTKVVNVLDVIEPTFSTVTKINTSKVTSTSGADQYAVKLTIDGETYILGNTNREKAGLTGANIYKKYTDVGAFEKIATDTQKIGYIFDNTTSGYTWNDLKVGSPIKFYAVGNTIVYAQSYKVDEVFSYVVLKDIVSYDSEALYADLYLNGKLLNDVAITKFDDQTLSALNIFQLTRLISDETIFANGNIFRAVMLSDGSYQLSKNLDRTETDPLETDSLDAFKLTQSKKFKSRIDFIDGIADSSKGGTNYSTDFPIAAQDAIRTKSSTTFYFLKKNAKDEITAISTYVGAPNKSSIDFTTTTGKDIEIYADKIGYGEGGYYGVASTILVYYTNPEDIKGFGVANVEYTTAYVVDNADKVKTYDMASAEELGLTSSEYAGKYFYSYTVDGLAIDMANGAKINTIYSEKAISKNNFYKISSDNVVIGTAIDKTTMNKATLAAADFVQNRYYVITPASITVKEEISTVKLTKSTAIDVKTDAPKDVFGTSSYVVYYIKDYDDGIFVGVAITGTSDVISSGVNAMWTAPAPYGNYAAIAKDVAVASDKLSISGKVQVAADSTNTPFNFTSYGANITDPKAWTGLNSTDYKFDKATITKDGSDFNGTYTVTYTIKEGVVSFTVNSVKNPLDPFATVGKKFEAGNYIIRLGFLKGTDSEFFSIPVVVK